MLRTPITFFGREAAVVVLLCAALCIAACVLRYGTAPVAARLLEARAQTEALDSLLRTGQADSLRAVLLAQSVRIDKLHETLVRHTAIADVSGFLQAVFALAYENNIRINRTLPQKEISDAQTVRHPIVLEMMVPYTDLLAFLRALQTRLPDAGIQRLSLTDTGNSILDARILLVYAERTAKKSTPQTSAPAADADAGD